MNGAGEAIYAWNATGAVRTAGRLADGSWSASRTVPGGTAAAGPLAVAIGRGGVAAVAWTTVATRHVPFQLLVSLRPAGGSFGAPVEIAPGTVAGAMRLGVDCAATVTGLRSDSRGVSAATLPGAPGSTGACSGTPGTGPWSAVAQVSTPHASASLAELAVNDAGDTLAVWQEGGAELRLSARSEATAMPSTAKSGDASLAVVTWTENNSLSARSPTLQAGVWTRQTLGPAYWGGTVSSAAGGGGASTGWARVVNGNPNAAQLVGRGTP